PQNFCAACGNPASNVCVGCKSDTYSRYYCGKVCQTNDRPNHKNACKDAQLEKALTRIAEIVQQAYLNFCETTWDVPVLRIDRVPDGLEIHWADRTKSTSHFSRFAAHLAISQNVHEATLVAMCCNEPQAHLHGLIKALVEEMPVKIEEPQVILRSVSQKITIFRKDAGTNANWPNYQHANLQIAGSLTLPVHDTESAEPYGLGDIRRTRTRQLSKKCIDSVTTNLSSTR
ncbi:hypothetical protein GGP41_009126, partial [Bipolaris sorokiniana]